MRSTFLLDDVDEFLDKLGEKLFKRGHEAIQRWRIRTVAEEYPIQEGNSFTLNASGTGDSWIYVNNTGRTLVIGRIIAVCVNYNPNSVFNGGYGYFYTGIPNANGNPPSYATLFDQWPNSPGGQLFPNTFEYSGHNALRLKKNETLSCYINSGPVNGNVLINFFGFLTPDDTDTGL